MGLLSVNHEQFQDILAVTNHEHFLCIYLFGSYIPIYISKSHKLFGTVQVMAEVSDSRVDAKKLPVEGTVRQLSFLQFC